MNADDVSLPKRLLGQVQYLSYNRDVVCVRADYEPTDARGHALTVIRLPKDKDEIFRNALAGSPPSSRGSAIATAMP